MPTTKSEALTARREQSETAWNAFHAKCDLLNWIEINRLRIGALSTVLYSCLGFTPIRSAADNGI